MVTAVTLAMTLGFETAESDIMKRSPRKPGEPLLSKLLIWLTCFVSASYGYCKLWRLLLQSWLQILLGAILFFIIVEIEKFLLKNRHSV